MKIAFSTLGCPDWSWDVILATAKDMGYDGIEIRGVANELYAPKIPAFSATKIEESKAKLDRMGLKLSSLTSACYLFDRDNIDTTLAEGREYIDLAAELGVPFVRVLGDRDPQPGTGIDDEFVAMNLKKLGDYALSQGVTVLIETNGVYADSARMEHLLTLSGTDGIGVLWDVHHPYRYFDETAKYTYGKLGKFIKYLHVKDSVVLPDGRLKYRMMGYGDVPVSQALMLLKEHGYDGYVSLEWVKRWYADLEAPGVVFLQYKSYMNRRR